MRKNFSILVLLFMVFFTYSSSYAQLKKDTGSPNISGVLSTPNSNFLLGFLDPSKIHMHHSFSMSYNSFAGQGMMLSTYLNTINFQLTEKLFLQTNLGLMSSPYNTLGENFQLNDPQLFGGAKLEYKFNENSSLQLQVDYAPYYYYQPSLGSYRFNSIE